MALRFIPNPFTRRMDAVSDDGPSSGGDVVKTGPVALPGDGKWHHMDSFATNGLICKSYQFAVQTTDGGRSGFIPYMVLAEGGRWDGGPGPMFGEGDALLNVETRDTLTGEVDIMARSDQDILVFFSEDFF